MFDLAIAKIMEMRIPARKRRKIFGHAFRHENMTRITAIHHPLRHVYARTGDVGTIVHIDDFIHRPAVNSHPQPNVGMVFDNGRDFHRAFNGRLWVVKEYKQHPIARRNAN